MNPLVDFDDLTCVGEKLHLPKKNKQPFLHKFLHGLDRAHGIPLGHDSLALGMELWIALTKYCRPERRECTATKLSIGLVLVNRAVYS